MKEMPISKVIYEGRTLIDLTSDTVTAEDLSSGVTAHDAKGNLIVGTGGISLNVFTQETEPETKDGVWIQTANPYENVVVGSETYSNGAVGEWGTWKDISTLPYVFISMSANLAVVYNGKIHILGSSNSLNGNTYKHYAFDGTNWTRIASLPYQFYSGSAVVYNNKIHILGGGDRTNTNHYAFDGTSWTQLSTLPYNFYNGSAVVYNNKIHILGGSYANTDHYAFDGTSWEKVSTLPYQFNHDAAVVYNNKIHILGSYISDYRNNHYAFDGTSWEKVSTLPYSFYDGSAVVYNNKIHILGGKSGGTIHEIFDGTSWTQLSTLPYNFYSGSAVVYDGKIHILGGGYTDTNTNHYANGISFSEIFTGSKVSIYQNPSSTDGTYATNFLSNALVSGEHNKFPSGFDDVFYIDESGNVEESPTYYGDGTQWIKFKN